MYGIGRINENENEKKVQEEILENVWHEVTQTDIFLNACEIHMQGVQIFHWESNKIANS